MSSRCCLLALVLTMVQPGRFLAPVPLAAGTSAQQPPAPLAPADAATATYRGLVDLPGPVTLIDGRWVGAPSAGGASRPSLTLLRGAFASGDLDHDGVSEAAVVLGLGSGGSGDLIHLAILRRQGAAVVSVATALVGDRVAIRAMRIAGSRVELDVVQAGPGDALCCPGELASRAWDFADGRLVERKASVTGRLSLDTIEATDWTLVALAFDEPAPPEPPLTLRVERGRVSGSSGCNSYFAGIGSGPSPGDVTITAVAGTRMMCDPVRMDLEGRFLAQLGAVTRFGFVGGQLALTYARDGARGTMLFAPRLKVQGPGGP